MSNAETEVENPFPAKAVTTFGVGMKFVAKFAYMSKAREHLVNYLKDYPSSGGALALSGGHGSGKTFLLNWLTTEAAEIKNRRSQAVYAKADNNSMPDAYKQLLRSITRSSLIEVTRTAVRNIGRNIAGAAQATKVTSLKIESAGTLQPALDEKIFDTNELYLVLRKELQKIGVSPATSAQVAYAIGILEHPEFGEGAFNWLAGGDPPLPKEMPVQGPLWLGDSTDAADIAVSALECIAGLYRLAEIPLILILDQMENFLSGENLTSTHASLLKKLVEQVSAQGAVLLMAGTAVAWDRLPRDVGPRLMNRAPLVIGGLNTDETALLLNVYLRTTPGFTPDAVATIRDLSGGSPREVLRIAHQAFIKSRGLVVQANHDVLVQAAQDSGSLADRAILALQMIDAAAERLKLSATPASTSDGQKIDRMVAGPPGACLAIVLLTSPDARAEAEDARRLTSLRKQLASDPNQPGLLVVTVGYSSPRVRALVGEFSRVLEFEENKFQELVEGELRRLTSPVMPEARKEALDFSPLLAHLTKLDERLARIEITRIDAEQETAEALQHGAKNLAESERAATEAKTRHELRFGLDELHNALAEGDSHLERMILRRLLVANEANVKDATFDYLGSIYLDALDSVQLITKSSRGDDWRPLVEENSSLRSDLIQTMRSNLSSWRRDNSKVRLPVLVGLLSGLFGAASTVVLVLNFSHLFRWIDSYSQLYLTAFIAGVFAGGLAGMLSYFYFDLSSRPERRYHYFPIRLSKIRFLANDLRYRA